MSTASNLSNLAHLVRAARIVDEKLRDFAANVAPLSYDDSADLDEILKESRAMMALIESPHPPERVIR